MVITSDVKYVGVQDHYIDLFEGQYVVPNGMAYNSYVIIDEKIAVTDSVDAAFGDEWIKNIKAVLGGKTPDYLIVHHVEPDHSSNILRFMKEFPNAQIVSSQKAFAMIKNFYGEEFENRRVIVKDGEKFSLGKHELTFVAAPMVHWPEVMVSFDSADKILFSADAFGKFGALDIPDEDDWACEARRYYFGIVGKYGVQVQSLLKKLAAFEIKTICPLHGPVLSENLSDYLGLYNTWSTYGVETEGVVICYATIYGNTKKAAELLKDKLEGYGVKNVVLTDVSRADWAETVEDAFRYGKIVFASSTYNGDVFPSMKSFIEHLVERNFQNRTVAFMENGTWAPQATKVMKGMLEGCKNLNFAENGVKILSGVSADVENQIDVLAQELAK